MSEKRNWQIKGKFYESCRTEGHCPLWFGRDLWEKPCVNFETYEIEEGQIGGVDMKGIIIIRHQDKIGPTFEELQKGPGEGAVYISSNATEEQKKVLEAFAKNNLAAAWKRLLGIKFVDINIKKSDRTFHITMPFGEQKITLTVGGDGKTPIAMGNCINPSISNLKFGNTDVWAIRDYGKEVSYRNTEGNVADFSMGGEVLLKLISPFSDIKPIIPKLNEMDYRIIWPVINKGTVGTDDMQAAIIYSPKGGEHPLHSHDVDELFVLLEGELVVTVGEKEYNMKQHDFMYFPANITHQAVNRSNKDAQVLVILAGTKYND